MVKSLDEVISDFNEIVNMTADEIDAYLKTEGSNTTGLSKDDGSGESIGHESGRKIVDILQRNPSKDPTKYTEEDKEHMRRVVSYCKRHLAQEGKLKETKGPEQLEKSKSTRSLKNWGHDPMKTLKDGETPASASKKADKPVSKKAEKPVSKKAEKPASKKETEGAKPTSKAKPVSKKAEKPAPAPREKEKEAEAKAKPVSKKAEAPKVAEKAEPAEADDKEAKKPASKAKPTSKKASEPVKSTEAAEPAKETAEADVREKRAAEPEKTEKPVSKKAKTTKPVSEGSRKPPTRGAKKA